jgi:hypothetical protein
MPENELLSMLRVASQQQGTIIARLDAIEKVWHEERSAIHRRIDVLADAERKHSDLVISWTPHVDRIRGATDATLARLGQAALIAVIVVAALVGGGALLPRLILPSVAPSSQVGGP